MTVPGKIVVPARRTSKSRSSTSISAAKYRFSASVGRLFADAEPQGHKAICDADKDRVAKIGEYYHDVKSDVLADGEHTYGVDDGELERFATMVESVSKSWL